MASQNEARGAPRGIEVLVSKAAVDADFRRLLMERRAQAAAEIALELTAAEAAMLQAVPAAQLEAIIDRTQVRPESRRAFLGKAAAAMLAALGAVAGQVRADGETSQGRGGVRPDSPAQGLRPSPEPQFGGVRPDAPAPSTRDPHDQPAKPVDRFADAPAEADATLACDLVALPAKAAKAARVYFRVIITNSGTEPLRPLAVLNHPGVSCGTGIGVEFCRAASPAPAKETKDSLKETSKETPNEIPKETPKEKASPESEKPSAAVGEPAPAPAREAAPAPVAAAAEPDQVPLPERPRFVLKPDDILSIMSSDAIAPGKKVSVPVTVRLPEEIGSFQVRAFLRSWAYADPTAKSLLDEKAVRQRFIRRIVSPVKTIEVTEPVAPAVEKPTPPQTPPAIDRGMTPDRIPVAGGIRPGRIGSPTGEGPQ